MSLSTAALLAVAMLAAPILAAYQGAVSSQTVFTATTVVSADPGLPCQSGAEALGAPDWDTICIMSADVSTCTTAGTACDVNYLCSGWVPNSTAATYPQIELAFISTLTSITKLEISEKGSRGWIRDIEFVASDGATHSVFSAAPSTWDTPSEEYKKAPVQQPNGPFYAEGLDYRGGTNTTTSGAPCVGWDQQSTYSLGFGNGLAGGHNYCRNPDNDAAGAWCYTATAGSGKQYCSLPVTEGCDDKPLVFTFAPAIARAYNRIRITMKRTYGAVAAIDAVSVTASVAEGCHSDAVNGYWKAPHCDSCERPWKGGSCNALLCNGTLACVYGVCNDATATCDCDAGFFGSDCASICPTNQVLSAINGTSGYLHPQLLNMADICSGHGTCADGNAGAGTCTCDPFFATSDCSVACPRGPNGAVCSNNGTCAHGAASNGQCTCNAPRYGTDCSKKPCGVLQCFNGECINGRCACHFTKTQGYWSGLTCNSCASGYRGTMCTEADIDTHTFNFNVGEMQDLWFAATEQWTVGRLYILPRVGSRATITLHGTGSVSLEAYGAPDFCRLDNDKTKTVSSCEVSVGGGYFGGPYDQVLEINQMFNFGGPSTGPGPSNGPAVDRSENYRIVVEYQPGCGTTSCGLHGYCSLTAAELANMGSMMMYSHNAATQRRTATRAATVAHTAGHRADTAAADERRLELRVGAEEAADDHHHHSTKRRSAKRSKRAQLVLQRAALKKQRRISGMLADADLAARVGRKLLQGPPPLPGITAGGPPIASKTATSITFNFDYGTQGFVTFTIVPAGATPVDVFGYGLIDDDIMQWNVGNGLDFQDFDPTSHLTSGLGGSLTTTMTGLTNCVQYDLWYEEGNDNGGSPDTWNRASLLSNVFPNGAPTVNSLSLSPQSTSMAVSVDLSLPGSKVYFCATPTSTGGINPGTIKACSGHIGGSTVVGVSGATVVAGLSGQLTPGTTYDIHYLATSNCAPEQDLGSVTVLPLTTLAAGVPDITSVTFANMADTSIDFKVTANAGGKLTYIILAHGSTPITAPASITAATVGTGGVLFKTTAAPITPGLNTIALNGLSFATKYIVCYFTENTAQTLSSNAFASAAFNTNMPPYPWVTQSNVVATLDGVTFDFDYTLDGEANFAVAPSGAPLMAWGGEPLKAFDITYWNTEALSHDYHSLPTAAGGTITGASFNSLTACQTYDVYYEAADSSYTFVTPPQNYMLFSFTTNAAPSGTGNVEGVGATTIKFAGKITTGTGQGSVYVCVLPAASAAPTPGAIGLCAGGQGRRLVSTGNRVLVTVDGLTAATAYKVHHAFASPCQTELYSTVTSSGTINTNAAGAPEILVDSVRPGVNNVTLTVSSDIAGTMKYAIQLASTGTAQNTQGGIDGLSVGGPVIDIASGVSLAAGSNAVTTASSLTADTVYMLNFYTQAGGQTNTYNTFYFSTGGAISYPYFFTAAETGVGAKLVVQYYRDGRIFIAVKDVAEPTPPSSQLLSESLAQPALFYHVLDVGVSDANGGTAVIDITNLDPVTEYNVYVTFEDVTGQQRTPTGSWWFETNLIGIAQCNSPAGVNPCTKGAFANGGICECFSGFTCFRGLCLTEAEFLAGLASRCVCDADSVSGFWNGTTCSGCKAGYFGSDCTGNCVNGQLNAAKTACNCDNQWQGTDCSSCPAVNGYYGENCDTQSPVVTNKLSVSVNANEVYYVPTFQVLQHSEVFLNISMHDEATVAGIKLAEIIVLKQYAPEDQAGTAFLDQNNNVVLDFMQVGPGSGPNNGPQVTVDACGNRLEVDPATPLTNLNFVFTCTDEPSWDNTKAFAVCRFEVPSGYNFAALKIVGAQQGSFDVTYRAVTGCCNGHGFCGEYDMCECVKHPDLGFYNFLDNCSSCDRGYTGASCLDFAGTPQVYRSGATTVAIGEDRWYGFRVQENMRMTVEMAADGDCDLTVSQTTRCGAGWTFNEGRCYKIFAAQGECVAPENAAVQCKAQGGALATLRSMSEWTFFRKLFTDSGIADSRQAAKFCSTNVHIDAKRFNMPCNMMGPQADELACTSDHSGGCVWNPGTPPGPSSCDVADSDYDCFLETNQANCHMNGPTRKPCQWVEYDVDNWGCVPSMVLRNSSISLTAMADILIDPTKSIIGTTPCDSVTQPGPCTDIPYCFWDGMGSQCRIEMMVMHNHYDSNLPGPQMILQWNPDSEFYRFPRCGYLMGQLNTFGFSDLANLYWGEMGCLASGMDIYGGAATVWARPDAAYMCERDPTYAESPVDHTNNNLMTATANQAAVMGVPDCTQNGIGNTATCSYFGGKTVDFGVVRVVCQVAATFDVNVTLVRDGRIDGFDNTFSCFHDGTQGSWAGEICTECAPRYTGRDCAVFSGCSVNSDCNTGGTCTAGYCTCGAGFYGLDCSVPCTGASTCNGGTCNAQYQVCPGPFGTSRPCNIETPLCISCPGQRSGSNCETCAKGYWDLTTDCGSACTCNGQQCDVSTGGCLCFTDAINGYWNVSTSCATCLEGYYGRTCSVFCDAASSCSGNGVCAADGTCACNTNYYGPSCAAYCTVAGCNNKGTCSPTTGACVCPRSFAAGFWTGATCSQCQAGYWGPNCVYECQCNARGSCDKLTGTCQCYASAALGYFWGSNCESCADGWSGTACKTSTASARNQMGIITRVQVATTARSVKPQIGGAMINFTSSTHEHVYAGTGKQVAEFRRPLGSEDPAAWEFVAACDIGKSTTADRIVAAEWHRGYAVFLIRATAYMGLATLKTDGTAFTSPTTCTVTHTQLATTEYLGANNTVATHTGYFDHAPVGMVLDAGESSLYVAYRVTNATLNVDRVYVARVFVWDISDIAKAFHHPRKNEFIRLDQFSAVTSIAIKEEAGVTTAFVGGLDHRSRVMFAKLFLPTHDQPSLRLVYTWYPPMCRVVDCTGVSRMDAIQDRLYAAVQTTTKLGISWMYMLAMDVNGANLKDTANNYAYARVPVSGATTCSFIRFDSYIGVVYVGVYDGATPGTVVKMSRYLDRTYSVSLPLGYEQTLAEFQTAVGALVFPQQRQMVVANQLTRSNIIVVSLYDVELIEPNVVAGEGGTIVNVTGNGFRNLGDIFCKFGGRLNRQLKAKYVSSTRVQCQAPMVTSFDPCVGVPLEIAFIGVNSFSNNQVLVTQANIPQVTTILPGTRGGLVVTEALTVIGSGFINTAYLTCYVDNEKLPATFVSSTNVLCTPPSKPLPVRTTIEMSLDGQRFSRNKVTYFFVGPPTRMSGVWTNARTGQLSEQGTWSSNSEARVEFPDMTVTFFDGAGTDVQHRDYLLRGHNVTATLTTPSVAPRGAGFGILRGNVTRDVIQGVAAFTDLFMEYPAAGDYRLNFTCSHPNISAWSVTFTVSAVATKLTFVTSPPPFSTNRAPLTQIVTIRFSDDSDNTATTEAGQVTASLIPLNSSTGASLSGGDVQAALGIATFDALRISAGEPGAFYELKFSATASTGSSLVVSSAPIRIASCDDTVDAISRIVPNAGTLGARVVEIKGWGYTRGNERYTQCKFGNEPPINATFVDTCTILCALPPRSVPFSAPLEVATDASGQFTTRGLNYSYVSTARNVTVDTSARTSYPSADFVHLDDLTVRFRDAFGNWLREFDTQERRVFMKTTLPLHNATGIVPDSLVTNGTSLVVFRNLTTPLPVIGSYGFFFSTDPSMPMPQFANAANQTQARPPAAPQSGSSPTQPQIIIQGANGTCPQPVSCVKMGRRWLECVFPQPEEVVSYTMTQEQNVPATTPPPVPAPIPVTAPPAVPPGVPQHFHVLWIMQITEGVPYGLEFVTFPSPFTTDRRKFDVQPVIRVHDVAGNTVENYASSPLIFAGPAPGTTVPPCITAAPAGANVTAYEETCERIAGAQAFVALGVATFSNLWIRGTLGQSYTIQFSISIGGVRPLLTPPIYVARCPAGNALLDHIEPNWVTNTHGGVITAKGWDFQPDKTISLNVGTDSITCHYVDTCTALCPINATNTTARRQSSLATPAAVDVSISSGVSTSATVAGGFQVKSAVSTALGFSRTAQVAYVGGTIDPSLHNQSLPVSQNISCTMQPSDPANMAIDCYRADAVVHINPIFVVHQDSGGGDIYAGNGWIAGTNKDVNVTVTLLRAANDGNRSIASLVRGLETTPTVNGIAVFDDLALINPRTGDYVFAFTTTSLNANNQSYTSREYTIRISTGSVYRMAVYRDGNVLAEGSQLSIDNGVRIALKMNIEDIARNPISIQGITDRQNLQAAVNVQPYAIIQPPPYRDILINNSLNYTIPLKSGNALGFAPSFALLGDTSSPSFDFSASSTQGFIYGVRYSATFSITDATYGARLPPQTFYLSLVTCNNGGYSKNLTQQCTLPLPEGSEVHPMNHSMWLFVQPGFWRPNFYDDVMYECPGANCLGGYYSECLPGTHGPVCAVCDRGYGKQGTDCLQCPSDTINIIVLVAVGIATLIVIIVMVNANLSTEVKPKSVFSIVIKILLNHLQTATLMRDFNSKVKGIVKDMANIQGQATPDTDFTSFACLTGWNMYAIFLMWMIVPVFVLGLPGLVAAATGVYQKILVERRKSRIIAEIERREKYGLNRHLLEVHLHALEHRELPECVFRLEGAEDSDEMSTPESDMENDDFDDVMDREIAAAQKREEDEERRDREVQNRARVMFGDQPGAVDESNDFGERADSLQGAESIDTAEFHDLSKPRPKNQGGLDPCTVCCADYAYYRCDTCSSDNFCEGCWAVTHASDGPNADHDRIVYRVINDSEREYNRKYEKMYLDVMAVKKNVPAIEVWIVTVLVVIFLLYPSLMTQIALMMKCVHVESINRSFLAADYSIECNTPEYNRWKALAQIFFFVYGLGIPLAGTLLLFFKRNSLLEKKTLSTYGFLYSGYRLAMFFWEFVIMVRKMLIVFIIVFYEGQADYSIMFGMWLILAFLLLNITVQPFQLKLYWKLENISLASVTITLNAAMLYQPRFNLDATSDALVTLFIFIVNVIVLAVFLYYIIFAARIQLLQAFDLDGSGDVSWSEFKLGIRVSLWRNHRETLLGWGFVLDDPNPEVAALKAQRKMKRMQSARQARAGLRPEDDDEVKELEQPDEAYLETDGKPTDGQHSARSSKSAKSQHSAHSQHE